MKNSSILFSMILLISLSFFTSCEKESIQPDDNTSINGGSDAPEPLDFFEDELVGKWVRYHSYDGSYRYYIFHSDRTACYFESIGSSRKNKKSYKHWELVDEGSNLFSIMVSGSSGTLYSIGNYKYAPDVILKGGYDNLKMTRSSTSKECE